MLKRVNNTVITLIAKIQNANSIKDFRSIACCLVVYKLISNIITMKMQSVIGEVVIVLKLGLFLASELIKCYSRKNVSLDA